MTEITHKSGLKVFILKKDFDTAYAVFATRYGSYDNVFSVDGERVSVPNGIAHFLEHKLFETEEGEDTFELFAQVGADANAYTSTDRTAYLFSCTENFYESLDILVKMVLTPVFTEENVSKEQGIIAQEIKMCEDRPTNIRYYNLMKALYGDDPVSIPIAGTVDSIARITPELLYKCYGAFYRMSNMALCLSGRVETDKVLSILDKHLPAEKDSGVIHEGTPDTDKVYRSIIKANAEINTPLVSIGIKVPNATGENSAAMDVMFEAVFGTCEDFYWDIYESEIVSSYSFYYSYSRAKSYFALTGKSDDPDELFRRVKDYIARVKEEGITKDAFTRAQRKAYASTVRGFDTADDIAEDMLDSFLNGMDFFGSIEDLGRVTYEQVNELLKTVMDEDRVAMSVVYPNSDVAKGE